MVRFYVMAPGSTGDCLAYRLQQEGYEVVLNIDQPWLRPSLEGIVPHTQRAPRQDEIVVFGTSGAGKEAQEFVNDGFAVIGAAPIADTLELNRWQFIQTCKSLGIDTPETFHFRDYEAARDFLRTDQGRFVFKPSGQQDNEDTYVAQGHDDLFDMLDHLEAKMPRADFLLQRFQEGIEISFEGWFDGTSWIEGSFNATMETKKFMSGDIGPATGCSTSTVWAYDQTPRWAKRLHEKFTALLRKQSYRGPLDLNTICTRNAMYVLEPCVRFGYDAIQNFVELWDDPLGEVLARLAYGELERLNVETDLLTASVRLSIPPFPMSGESHKAPDDVPVCIDEGDMQRLWPSGIRYDKEQDAYFTAPVDGILGALVAHGTTLDRAVEKLCAAAKRIRVPNLQWRNDIGDGNIEKWQQLAKWGFDLPPTAAKLVKRLPAAPQSRPSGLGGR